VNIHGAFWFTLRCIALLLAACLGPVPHGFAAPTEIKQISLRVGEQQSLSAQGVKSYSEGVLGIVEVRLPKDGEQFVLLALKPGQTTLLLFMLDGREVQVRIDVQSDRPDEPEIVVRAEDNIRLDLYFVQVSEGYGHQLGFAWPDAIGGGASLSASFDLKRGDLSQASLGVADQVLPRLDLAERTGYARVRRQAAVVAENGKQASFDSGGEVNVPIQGALTAEVRAIQFGSQLAIEPRFDKQSGRIELKVSASVADLTDDGGTGIPGRNVSKLETVVNLDLGKSLVLAGLDSASDAQSSRGLPGLSRIPILGGLFGSRNRRSEKLQNLLFVVPSVVQAVTVRDRSFIQEMLEAYEGFEGKVDSVSLLSRASAPNPVVTP